MVENEYLYANGLTKKNLSLFFLCAKKNVFLRKIVFGPSRLFRVAQLNFI